MMLWCGLKVKALFHLIETVQMLELTIKIVTTKNCHKGGEILRNVPLG